MLYNSEVSIGNLTLAHLKVAPIVSLTEANERARQLNRIFIPCRDTCLRAKHWKFAGVIEALQEVADQTVPGWDYIYGQPAKCLGIRKVFDDIYTQDPKPLEYKKMFIPAINRIVICAKYPTAYIDYTYQVEDPTLFDQSFVMAFSFLMAASIGATLTGDDNIAAKMMQNYLMIVSDAMRINDTEEYIKKNETSSIEDAR